jgi:hypothetical protein
MRMWEIVAEEIKANTYGDNLKKQADAKADQAKKLKPAASVQKKREQVNSTRASMMKKQGDLTKAMSAKI